MNANKRDDAISVEFTAFNFAEDSTNKIHGDDVARQHGYRGGLVPGIAVFGYMSHAVVATWGRRWLERGFIRASFIKPVYAGDRACVTAEAAGDKGRQLEIEVTNQDGLICAAGLARLSDGLDRPPAIEDYPKKELPSEDRLKLHIEGLSSGGTLGSLAFFETGVDAEARARRDYLDTLDVYSGPGAPYHPAYLLAQANRILMRNVNLGPWIHVKSEMSTFAAPAAGERLNIRGRIARSYVKKGHDMVDLDLAVFDNGDRAVATVGHTAVVRLRRPDRA